MSTNGGVKDDDSGKPYRRLPITSANVTIISQNNKHSAIAESIRNIEKRGIITISEVVAGDERENKDACRTTLEVADTGGQIVKHLGCEEDQRRAPADQRAEFVVSDDEVSDVEGYTVNILAKSTHRDGSIYRGMDTWWKEEYCIADRNETRLEAMTLSESTDCIFYDGTCVEHYPGRMLQIFSIKVANISLAGGSVELYGYIATRDDIDPLLNYVFSFSRDDPIIVRQGSFINMTGPKRGIDICDRALLEYDIRIKTGEHEKDDLQLIDGISIIGHVGTWNRPFSIRIPGDCGAVGITLSRLEPAVEATIDVLVSEVQSSFNLFLGCFTSGLIKEIQLFDGAIFEPCGLKRSVVVVVIDDFIDLKFKVGVLPSNSDQLRCTFEAKTHGHDTQEIRTDFALLSVKMTWSTLPRGTLGL